MGKSVKFTNIQGGKTPYKSELIPIGVQSSDTFNDVPNGTFRGKVIDDDTKTTLPKTVVVNDVAHITDRNINWNKIPSFQLPAGLQAVWGWGSPRWLDESQPTDALNHGWTHTDNNQIDGVELVNAKRVKTIYMPYGGANALYNAINEIKSTHPSVDNATVIQVFTVINNTSNPENFTYKNYLNNIVNATVGANDDVEVECLFGETPSYYSNPGIIRIKNPFGVTEAAYIALGRAYYNQEKWLPDGATGNNIAYRLGIFFYNEETLGNAGRANQLLIKGMAQEAAAQGNPFKVIYYGKSFTEWQGGFYSGQQNDNVSWKQKVFPALKANIRISAQILNEYADLQALGDANCVYLNVGSYFKVPFPQTNTKYEKQNGNYVIDQDGERKYRIGNFNETIRGQNVTFLGNTQVDFWVGSDPSYGYPNDRVSEMFWAIIQFYASCTQIIYANIAIAKKYRGNEDIYTQFDDLPVKTCAVVRDETEGTGPGYANIPRPITTFQIEHTILVTYALCEMFCVWSDYANQTHPNQNLPFAARNKGTGHANGQNPNGNNFQQFSQYEDMTWALKQVAYAHENHGVFGAGNKKIVAYQPADITHEIMIFGRLKSNKIWIVAAEPRLDPNEVIVVTITNKKNSYTQKFGVQGGQNFVDTFTLPASDSYEPADIIFSYKDIYDVSHQVTGDLRQHLVTTGGGGGGGIQNGTSIFEFFSPTNGNPYPSPSPAGDGIKQGNGYISFQFAAWSIISSPTATTPINIQSHIEMQMWNPDGVLIANIIDRRGNYHPNYIPYFPSGTDLRSNNHLPEFFKYLPVGNGYRIKVKNASIDDVTMQLKLGWQGTGGTTAEIKNMPLVKGAIEDFIFNVAPTLNDGSNSFVMNFNVLTYP